MSACKSYQRQLALLSVAALDDTEKAAALEHLSRCPACQSYANQLQGIVGLFTQDAQRQIAPPSIRATQRRPQPGWIERFLAPKPALAGLGIILLAVTAFLFRERPQNHPPTPRASAVTPVSPVLSIANSRQLAEKDLEELLETDTPSGTTGTKFVF